MMLSDVDSFYIHDFKIEVDILKQQQIISSPRGDQTPAFTLLTNLFGNEFSEMFEKTMGTRTIASLPTNPLNTDGIDPAGSNITITRVNITNFDDAIAVKPSHGKYVIAKDGCSQDIHVSDMNIKFGVGMSLGSVPPKRDHNCIRRVTFKRINFEYPLKAIYVKTNPVHDGVDEESG